MFLICLYPRSKAMPRNSQHWTLKKSIILLLLNYNPYCSFGLDLVGRVPSVKVPCFQVQAVGDGEDCNVVVPQLCPDPLRLHSMQQGGFLKVNLIPHMSTNDKKYYIMYHTECTLSIVQRLTGERLHDLPVTTTCYFCPSRHYNNQTDPALPVTAASYLNTRVYMVIIQLSVGHFQAFIFN